jgi:dipeptidyl aminopeptidase/acylaminoacyl peptidase
VKYPPESHLPAEATGQLLDAFRDYSKEKPVGDDVFAIYRSLYVYDKTPLNALVEAVDETLGPWKREKITFDAPYGRERVTAYLFIPKKSKPPYQTVLFFPGSGVIGLQSFQNESNWAYNFLVESGRAVMYPIYKSTFERADELTSDVPAETSLYRDHVLIWAKELGRSIDYLETRDDIDKEKLAYYGVSWGGSLIQLPAVEDRIKVNVLVGSGFYSTKAFAEVDHINFLPRVKAPVLVINGRSDFFCPVETCLEPFYRLLGTPEADRRLVITDSGHSPPRNELIKETLDWLDRNLGPVE